MTLRIILQAPGFFSIPFKRVQIETIPNTGRTYFIHNDRIVAVAIQTTGERK